MHILHPHPHRWSLLVLSLCFIIGITAQVSSYDPYYSSITPDVLSSPQTALVALHTLISKHTILSYDDAWDAFKITDDDAYDTCSNGTLHDTYSNICWNTTTSQCGNYKALGDCYNREHSWPKSWFGGMGNQSMGAGTDLVHLFPTDGWVNGRRSNWPFGEVANGGKTQVMHGGKLGPSITPGYTGTAFEPRDDVKGDFARVYFYMTTAYADMWECCDVEAVNRSHIKPWALTMLKRWHQMDPVSDAERERNREILTIQGNKNPFVDHPEWVDVMGDFIANPPIDHTNHIDGTVPTYLPPTTEAPTTEAPTTVSPTTSTPTNPYPTTTVSPPVTVITFTLTFRLRYVLIDARHLSRDLITDINRVLGIPIQVMIVVSITATSQDIRTNMTQVTLALQQTSTITSQQINHYATIFRQEYIKATVAASSDSTASLFSVTEDSILSQLVTSTPFVMNQQETAYQTQSCADGTTVLITQSCEEGSTSSSAASTAVSLGMLIGMIGAGILVLVIIVSSIVWYRRKNTNQVSQTRRTSIHTEMQLNPAISGPSALV